MQEIPARDASGNANTLTFTFDSTAPKALPLPGMPPAHPLLSRQALQKTEATEKAGEGKKKLEPEQTADPTTLKTAKYIVVVASYAENNRYGKLYLKQIGKTYGNATLFRSEKRKLDYLYVDDYQTLEPALARMKEIRNNPQFHDARVHITRLSRQD